MSGAQRLGSYTMEYSSLDTCPCVSDLTGAACRTHTAENPIDSKWFLVHFQVANLSGAPVLQAQAIDAKVAAGEAVGPLAGVPVAIKDNICTAGVETTAGSHILRGYVPSYDATAVARLRAAGAIIIGKTNCDEFGMGSSTENSAYKITRNAVSREHVPGADCSASVLALAAFRRLCSSAAHPLSKPTHNLGTELAQQRQASC